MKSKHTLVSIAIFLTSLPFSLALISPEECAFKFQALGFDPEDYDNYPKFYANDSVLTLTQAGSYYGPKDIEEYVRFADPESPYIKSEAPVYFHIMPVGYDPVTESCSFLSTSITQFTLDYRTATPGTFEVALLSRITYNAQRNKISSVALYYAEEYLKFIFDELLNTRKSKQFICSTLINDCSELHAMNFSPSFEKCVDILEELPVFSSGGMITGFDQGCRHLHAVLAKNNPAHCAHISFIPVPDSKGQFKCQSSVEANVSALFSSEEIQIHNQLISENGIDPELGYKVICKNSDDWITSLVKDKQCDWISEDPHNRCGLAGAKHACAVTCHESCLAELSASMEPEETPTPAIE